MNSLGGARVRGETPGYPMEESEALLSLRVDLLDLFHQGLIRFRKRERSVRMDDRWVKEERPWPAMPQEVNPGSLSVSPSGTRLVKMMRLDKVSLEDQEVLVMQHVRWPDR